jgi:hypothetical protein
MSANSSTQYFFSYFSFEGKQYIAFLARSSSSSTHSLAPRVENTVGTSAHIKDITVHRDW